MHGQEMGVRYCDDNFIWEGLREEKLDSRGVEGEFVDLRAAEHSEWTDGELKTTQTTGRRHKDCIESCTLYFSLCMFLSTHVRWRFVEREECGKPSF